MTIYFFQIKGKSIKKIPNYSKLVKYQKEQLECALKAKPLSLAKEKGFKKIQNELVEKAKSLQLNQSILEVAKMIGGEIVYIPKRQGEARHTLADVSKAERLLLWKPKIELKNYLKELDIN